MRENTCCITGHRPEKLAFGYDESHPDCIALKENLSDCVRRLIEWGYTTFISGMAQGSDIFFAEAVLSARQAHKAIRLLAAVPYKGQERRWAPAYKRRYRSILRRADEVVVLSPHYQQGCFMHRNRFMVDNSSLLIAVYTGQGGGTGNTISYAASKDLSILWFNPQTRAWAHLCE